MKPYQCIRCGRMQHEQAGRDCQNKVWHDGMGAHFNRNCESMGHCPCFEDGPRCCSCRDRKL